MITSCTITPSMASRMPMDELTLWKDTTFKKQFIESYIATTDVEPPLSATDREEMTKILALISSDKMDDAARSLEHNRNNAANAIFDFTVGNIYFQKEKLDQAAAAYEIAVKKYTKFRRAWRNLGLIYVRQSLFDKAIPALTHAVQLGDTDALTYGLLGFAYSSTENNLSAETSYRMAILLDPATLDWKMGLARSLFKQEKYADAVTLCDRLIADQPERADLWLLQANAYIGLKQPLKAAENYEFVDQLGKSTVDSMNMLGDIYVNEELYDMAVQAYSHAMEKSTQNNTQRAIRAAKVLATRGAIEQTHALVEKIEKLYEGKLEPEEQKEILKLHARLAVAEGAGEEEARVLEEIINIDPMDGEALILLGQYNNRMGNVEKAIFYFERAESIEKYEAEAKVRHAQLLVGKGKYDDALPLLRRAQAIKPRDDIQKYLDQVEQIAKIR